MLKPITIESLGVTRRETILSNGTKLVVFERPGMPVCIRSVFYSGSRFDPTGKDGNAHFNEHILVGGSQQFPTKDKLAGYIEQFGGSLGATTGSEILSINSAVGDPDDIEIAMQIQHEIILAPLFNIKTIETERGAILKELGDKKSNPGNMIWEVQRRLFYQETEVGRSTLGSEETINNITRNDLLQYYNDMILPGRKAIVVSGGVELEKVEQLAETYLTLSESGQNRLNSELPIIRSNEISIEHYTGLEQAHLIFGFRTVPFNHPHSAILTLISEVLGGGRASSLNKILRLERGLVYGVNAFNLEISDAGSWMVKTSTSKDNIQEVINLIVNELNRILNEGLTPEEILFAQNKIIKSKRIQLQTSGQWIDWNAQEELLRNPSDAIQDYTSAIINVTPEMTRDVAQKYFGPNKWYLGMCGDVSGKSYVVNF